MSNADTSAAESGDRMRVLAVVRNKYTRQIDGVDIFDEETGNMICLVPRRPYPDYDDPCYDE
jgi:hypothetical protein